MKPMPLPQEKRIEVPKPAEVWGYALVRFGEGWKPCRVSTHGQVVPLTPRPEQKWRATERLLFLMHREFTQPEKRKGVR